MQIGTAIGAYQIIAKLGEGGMGEVWRATDTTLGREVAIKILPDAFAADPERLSRFEREAKTLASLNHPNIAAIYAVGGADGRAPIDSAQGREARPYIVMELVEGDDLSQRIARGAMPLDEALPIAKQIADALEAAHEQGIVHRDLKPANIKVRSDGVVKVLDFGLAKALHPEGDGLSRRQAEAEASALQTITSPAMTMRGVILGTATYMSPEQAKGKSVDRRADIWAFGGVLFEMLVGKPAFAGETVTDILARVMERDPDWSLLPSATPPHVRRVLRRCLEKDPARRLRHVADARLELDDTHEPQTAAAAPVSSAWLRLLPWSLAAVMGLAAIAAVVTRPATSVVSRELLHFDITNPPGVEVQASFSQSFALSPDGTRLAFVGFRDGVRQLFVRGVADPEVLEIPGIGGAISVAFAPDGSALAFISANSSVMTFQFGDSANRTVATGADALGGVAWGTPGLVFQQRNELWFVDPKGGSRRQLTTLDLSRGRSHPHLSHLARQSRGGVHQRDQRGREPGRGRDSGCRAKANGHHGTGRPGGVVADGPFAVRSQRRGAGGALRPGHAAGDRARSRGAACGDGVSQHGR